MRSAQRRTFHPTAICTAIPLLLGLLAAVSPAACAPSSPSAPLNVTWWRPRAGSRWQMQLSGANYSAILAQRVPIYDVDVDDLPNFLKQAKASGLPRASYRLMCYFSVGTYEPYRVAADKARGLSWSALEGAVGGSSRLYAEALDPPFQDERWLLLADAKVRAALVKFMTARIAFAKRAGCDGVDMDNVDAYDNVDGGRVKVAHEVAYVGALVDAAHALGLGAGLKNALDLLPRSTPDGRRLTGLVDWYVNERCAEFSECGAYAGAGVAGSALVMQLEYCDAHAVWGGDARNVHPDCVCGSALKDARRTTALIKDVDLRKAGLSCAVYCARPTSKCSAPPKGSKCFFTSPANSCPRYGVV